MFSAAGGLGVAGAVAGAGLPPTSTAAGVVTSIDGLYSVTVNASGTTVAALAGTVELKDKDGKTIKVDVGTGKVFDANGNMSTKTLAQIVADEKSAGTAGGANSVTSSLALALKTVADNTAAGTYGANATNILSSLTKVLVAANPDAASSYVATAVTAITSSNSGATNKADAAAAIVKGSGVAAGSAAAVAATNAAAANGVTVTVTTTTPIVFTTPITPVEITAIVSPSGGNK